MSKIPDQVLTPAEAAKELKVSLSFLAKARMNGTGPAFIRCGRSVRYSVTALEVYKAAQTRTSTSQYPKFINSPPLVKTAPSRPKKPRRSEEPDLLDHLSSSISVHQNTSSKS
jgi:hypothetical protein